MEIASGFRRISSPRFHFAVRPQDLISRIIIVPNPKSKHAHRKHCCFPPSPATPLLANRPPLQKIYPMSPWFTAFSLPPFASLPPRPPAPSPATALAAAVLLFQTPSLPAHAAHFPHTAHASTPLLLSTHLPQPTDSYLLSLLTEGQPNHAFPPQLFDWMYASSTVNLYLLQHSLLPHSSYRHSVSNAALSQHPLPLPSFSHLASQLQSPSPPTHAELSDISLHPNFHAVPVFHHGLDTHHMQHATPDHFFPTPSVKGLASTRVTATAEHSRSRPTATVSDPTAPPHTAVNDGLEPHPRRSPFPLHGVITYAEKTLPASETLNGEQSPASVGDSGQPNVFTSASELRAQVPPMLSDARVNPMDSNLAHNALSALSVRHRLVKRVARNNHVNDDAYQLQEDTPLVRDIFSSTDSPQMGGEFTPAKSDAAKEQFYDEFWVSTLSRLRRKQSTRTPGQATPAKQVTLVHMNTERTHDVMQLSVNPRQARYVSSSSPDYVMSHAANTRLGPNSSSAPLHPPANATTPRTALDEEHALADEAWQLVDKYFVSPSFNGVDWAAERSTLASASLPSRKATYAALRKSFRKLSDRYTRLLSPREMNALRRFDVSGVGLLLTTDATGSLVVATDPPADSAAALAGVVRGDVLQAVEGESVEGAAAFSVSERMQGPDGSDLHVTFRGKEPVTLRRSFPPATGSAAVRAKLVDAGDGSRLGYIRLSEFRASSREEVARASQKLVDKGADWIALDLRGNGGGVFEGALEIAGLFEGSDVPVARVEGRADASRDVPGKEETYSSRLVDGETQVPAGVDLAVLIDRGSASSSEVLAGALRDRCRAALVGERSYGKGVIQGVFGLSDGGGVIVTVAEYRTPNGDRIQGVGLTPDVRRKMGGLERAARAFGIEKVDETTVNVGREEVQEAVKMCVTESGRMS